MLLETVKSTLIQKGFTPLTAFDGEQGLFIATEELPDLIILDVCLPDISGYEVCQRLKANKRTADIPVIFLTVRHLSPDKKRGLSVGACSYITKPFNMFELLTEINRILGE